MNLPIYSIAFACAAAIAVGQVLFKFAAESMSVDGTPLSVRSVMWAILALSVYGGASVAWLWVLQRGTLGQLYPFMAIAYVLVPIASWCFFGEQFHAQYVVGVLFILIGIWLTTHA